MYHGISLERRERHRRAWTWLAVGVDPVVDIGLRVRARPSWIPLALRTAQTCVTHGAALLADAAGASVQALVWLWYVMPVHSVTSTQGVFRHVNGDQSECYRVNLLEKRQKEIEEDIELHDQLISDATKSQGNDPVEDAGD
jgi:hypothetical protein